MFELNIKSFDDSNDIYNFITAFETKEEFKKECNKCFSRLPSSMRGLAFSELNKYIKYDNTDSYSNCLKYLQISKKNTTKRRY